MELKDASWKTGLESLTDGRVVYLNREGIKRVTTNISCLSKCRLGKVKTYLSVQWLKKKIVHCKRFPNDRNSKFFLNVFLYNSRVKIIIGRVIVSTI